MNFREAGVADSSRIASLHAGSWRHAYRGMLSDEYLDIDLVADRAKVWAERLSAPRPKQRVVLAEINGQLAGFACAFGSNDPKLGTLLDNIHVSPEFQRRGIGAKLMNEIVSCCKAELPGEGLFLWVLAANWHARHFYERLGGAIVNEDVWHSPDGGLIPSLCYAWRDLDALTLALTQRKTVILRISATLSSSVTSPENLVFLTKFSLTR